MIKFYCERCGKEMWELIRELGGMWDNVRHFTLDQVNHLLVCSDCLLKEIREDKAVERAARTDGILTPVL